MMAMDVMKLMLPKERYRINKSEKVLELVRTNGDTHSTIFFSSADNPDTLRGEAIKFAILDEAAFWSEEAVIAMFTTLTRTQGNARIFSTPKGRNIFHDLWQKGNPENPDKDPKWMSYRFPTWENPYVTAEAIEDFRNTMPGDAFRQEICAEFLEEGAGVFRNMRACSTGEWIFQPQPGRRYVIGLDLAKHQDYSVLTVCDHENKQVCTIDRSQHMEWQVQIDRAITAAKQWNNAMLVVDSTGIGDVVYDSIRGVYPHVIPYTIGNSMSKTALIQRLQFALENQRVILPDPKSHPNASVLRRELEAYAFEISMTGKFIYSAPEGKNDDCVISLALANWVIQEEPQKYRARSMRGF
jgi:phage terminase large subunit-like protein